VSGLLEINAADSDTEEGGVVATLGREAAELAPGPGEQKKKKKK